MSLVLQRPKSEIWSGGHGGAANFATNQSTLQSSKFGRAPSPARESQISDLEVSLTGDVTGNIHNACTELINTPNTHSNPVHDASGTRYL